MARSIRRYGSTWDCSIDYGISGPANNWRWDEETRGVLKANSAYQFPQASACFIQSVSDDMEGIMRLAKSEAMLFKFGSGTGTDLSTLRSSHEKLSGGGKPSGPVSFMRVYDAIASVVKSGVRHAVLPRCRRSSAGTPISSSSSSARPRKRRRPSH